MTAAEAVQLLEEYRAKHSLSKQELARKMRMSVSTLKHWLAVPGTPSHGLPGADGVRSILQFLQTGEVVTKPAATTSSEQIRSRQTPTQEAFSNSKANDLATKSAIRLKAELSLIQIELEFFRDGSKEDRNVLKRIVQGADVGRISGLLTSLYDEDQLVAWLTFSEEGRNK